MDNIFSMGTNLQIFFLNEMMLHSFNVSLKYKCKPIYATPEVS